MSLVQTINDAIKDAMRNKKVQELSVLRQLKTAFNNEAISLKKKDEGLSEEEALVVTKREAKKRKDSIAQFREGGREDLASAEEIELQIISQFLPEELSEEVIGQAVDEVISEMGEASMQQFGQIMSAAMKKLGTQADGSVVSKVVKEKLG